MMNSKEKFGRNLFLSLFTGLLITLVILVLRTSASTAGCPDPASLTIGTRLTLSAEGLCASRTFTFPDASGELAILDATQRLSNKTLIAPIVEGGITSPTNTNLVLNAGNADKTDSLVVLKPGINGGEGGIGVGVLPPEAATKIWIQWNKTHVMPANADNNILVLLTQAATALGTNVIIIPTGKTANEVGTLEIDQPVMDVQGKVRHAFALRINNEPTGGDINSALWIDKGTLRAENNVFMANDLPDNQVNIGSKLPGTGKFNLTNGNIFMRAYGTENRFISTHANGTEAAPTITSNGTVLFGLSAEAHDGTTYRTVSELDFEVDGVPVFGQRPPSRFSISTTPSGGEPEKRIYGDSQGNIGVGATNFGTDAVRVLAVKNGRAPITPIPDGVQLWAEGGKLKVMDAQGHITTVTP